MITENQIRDLKTESLLSNTFTMAKDDSGEWWVVFGRYMVDHITFKTLLLWRLAGHTSYARIMNSRDDHIVFLKSLNTHDKKFQQQNGYSTVDFLVRQFNTVTANESKSDLVNRYKQYILE